MVVPSSAEGFRAAVSALLSLDGKEGLSFHTFTLPEDRCVRLLVMNLGRSMPESVVREELKSLNIPVQGVTQVRSGRRIQDPAKDRPPTPTSSYRWHEGLRCPRCDHSRCRWSRTRPQKAHCNASAASATDTCSLTADKLPGASRVDFPPLRWLLYPAGTASVLWLRGKPHGKLPGLR